MLRWHRFTGAVGLWLLLPLLAGPTTASPVMSPVADEEAVAPPRRVRVLGMLPRFRLKNQAGRAFGTAELDGKVWVATFVFTRCSQTCPMQMAQMAQLQRRLADRVDAQGLRFVSISVDPDHDTPEVLAAYARDAGADLESWTLLTGEREAIWTLCRDGFKLPVEEAEDPAVAFAHSASFVLVDRAGRIRGHYDGLEDKAIDGLVADLGVVVADPPGPVTAQKDPPLSQLPGPDVYQPAEVRDAPWLEERARAQERTRSRFRVRHEFGFVDRQPESGVDFVNRVVDDGAKDYKGVHYDHGNGVSVADVDGDGRLDLYFVNQLGSNALYRNLGGGRFEDVTQHAGVGLPDVIGVTASFADVDNDGDPDLYVTNVREGNRLFLNDGEGRFADVTEASGLGYRGHSSSAVFFDYDRDGLLDLFLLNVGVYTTDERGRGGYWIGFPDGFAGHLESERTEASILYRNLGEGRFADVSEATGLVDESWSGAASPLDLDEDGWTDLYVLNMQGHDEYYRNLEGRRFERRGREVFPRTPWGSMGVKAFDWNNDGLLDLFVTDMHTDMVDDLKAQRRYWYAEKIKPREGFPPAFLATDGNHVLGNAFFENEGEGRFRERSDEIGAETYWPWGLSVGDLNADGWEDVFVTASMNYPYRYGVNSVLLNDEGREWLDSEFLLGVEPRRERRTSAHWFDLDCDGEDAERRVCWGRTGSYRVHGALGSRSSALLDLDDDGDLDVVTNDFNSEPLVLVSDLAQRHPDTNWLKVALEGTRSNRDGLGARVRVSAGSASWIRVHDGQSGYLSQSLIPLYFGLGDASVVDRIEVLWPSGTRQVLEGPLEARRLLTIREE